MTHPPAAPGPAEGPATQSFPAGGAPPPPPPEHRQPPAAPTPQGPQQAWGPGPFPPPPGYGAPQPPAVAPGPAPAAAPVTPSGPVGAPPTRRRGRIVGRAVLVLVVIGALAGTTAWGFVNRSSAQEWKERSQAADADLERALARVASTEEELEESRQRLRELANEAAGETDLNRILSDIVEQAPEVTAALADCQQETTDLANDIIAAFDDPAADVTELQLRTDEVNEICETALTQAEELEAAIDELGL